MAMAGRTLVPLRGWLGLRQPKDPAAVVAVMVMKTGMTTGSSDDNGDNISNDDRHSNRNSNVETMVTVMALGYMQGDDSGVRVTCNRRDSKRDNTPLVLLLLPLPTPALPPLPAANNKSFAKACQSES